MYRYADPSDNSHLTNYESYDRIFDKLDGFMTNLASSEEKELLLKMVSEVCYKQHKAILTKSESVTELMLSSIMALPIEQSNGIESIDKNEV